MKHQSGFILVVFVGLLMAGATALWLVQVTAAYHEHERALAHLQQQLHTARVQLFWQAIEKEPADTWLNWQTHPDRLTWLESLKQQGLQAKIEVHPLRLVVELHSDKRAHMLSNRLVKSVAQGSELHLNVPEQQPQDTQAQSIQRIADTPQVMATDLRGAWGLISNAQQVSGKGLVAQTVQSELLHAKQSQSDSANIQQVTSHSLNTAIKVVAQGIDSQQLLVSQTSFDEATMAQLQAQNMVVQKAHVPLMQINTGVVAHTKAKKMNVLGVLSLTGQEQLGITQFQESLSTLEQAIYYCLHESKWCLAPIKPTLHRVDCQNCQSQQYAEYFLSVLEYEVSNCRHGCGIRLQVPNNIEAHCPKASIPAGGSGKLRCEVSGNLIDASEYSFVVQAQLYSMKNPSVYLQQAKAVQWQLLATECEAKDVSVTILERWPPATYTLTLPTFPGGETYAWYGNIEYPCNNTANNQLMFCDMAAFCSRYGAWQDIQASCICRDW
ncbi:hypothetical protein CWE15_01675 [Aliidiomarina taiwanensis]|uniref:Uncharacterized protein n=1 Tax=Aliidiomarina taiwanensis TaxID=946228 RepID=A0A432X984_9GAMM|nr:hypothetical protein [Aliidiomarina taiwanensis]RUO43919.1 hypothetical protein CWE15_01675 [Aliidiomarina taiwanensis]